MNVFADALDKAGVKISDFENVDVDEKAIERDLEIEFWDQWLKMIERGASDKEKYLFATKHGFVSEKHLNLYLSLISEVNDIEYELYEYPDLFSPEEIKTKEKELEEKRSMAQNIKYPWYYRHVMHQLKIKDVSPYGLDVVRDQPFAATKKERFRQYLVSN